MREIMRRKIRMVYIYISMNDKNDLVKMVWQNESTISRANENLKWNYNRFNETYKYTRNSLIETDCEPVVSVL